jgi:hypothetical protein
MSIQISDQERKKLKKEAEYLESFGDNGSWLKMKNPFPFPISPVAWIKLPPDPNKSAIEVLAYDMGHALCILNPIFLLFFSIIKWFTDIRISDDVFIYFGPLISIFSMGIHCLIIKCYPYLEKINKFTALLLTKAIPVLIIFGMWGKIISYK